MTTTSGSCRPLYVVDNSINAVSPLESIGVSLHNYELSEADNVDWAGWDCTYSLGIPRSIGAAEVKKSYSHALNLAQATP